MEWAMPTGKKVHAPVAGRVGGELKVPALVRHTDDDGPMPDQLLSHARTSRSSGTSAFMSTAASAARRRRPRASRLGLLTMIGLVDGHSTQ
jgi:hypothetical protein